MGMHHKVKASLSLFSSSS